MVRFDEKGEGQTGTHSTHSRLNCETTQVKRWYPYSSKSKPQSHSLIQKRKQLHHVKEPRGKYVNSEDRSDIVVFNSASGVDLELDIALAHPWSNELEGLSATTQRAAATRRENLKIKKYDQELLPGGFRPTFVPIVFEHFGCWGEKAEEYLKKLSQLSRDEDGKPNAATFKTYWRSVFSVCLQPSNARVIDRKIKKIVSRDSHININSCR